MTWFITGYGPVRCSGVEESCFRERTAGVNVCTILPVLNLMAADAGKGKRGHGDSRTEVGDPRKVQRQ